WSRSTEHRAMEADVLWKLLRTFPQDLENASRFPHLPQPLPATRNKRNRRSKLPINRCPPCPRPPVHHVSGPNRPAGGLLVVSLRRPAPSHARRTWSAIEAAERRFPRDRRRKQSSRHRHPKAREAA